MKKKRRPYLDYYKKYNISPVLSKVDLKLHSNQRTFLYTKLGITPSSIQNKNILEFGPGNGLNAIITNSFNPKKYFLVDANPAGIKNCKKNCNGKLEIKKSILLSNTKKRISYYKGKNSVSYFL